MKPVRALILSDSLGLPRFKGSERVQLQQTYIDKIRCKFPNLSFVHIGIPAGTVCDLRRLAEYYSGDHFSYVILQSGIVDCAPRAFTRFELEVIKRLRIYRLVKPLISFLRRCRKICYTEPDLFERSLEDIKLLFPQAKFITCGIIWPRPEYEQMLPGIGAQIEIFNGILSKHSTYIDNRDFPEAGIASDHHHLNLLGNQILADRIVSAMGLFVD